MASSVLSNLATQGKIKSPVLQYAHAQYRLIAYFDGGRDFVQRDVPKTDGAVRGSSGIRSAGAIIWRLEGLKGGKENKMKANIH